VRDDPHCSNNEDEAMNISDDDVKIAHRGGQLIKILHLAGLPGMDEVAVKLNCGLTWDEQRTAEKWFIAFQIARLTDQNIFEMASELNKTAKH
jgi:hypothetical protein